MSRRRRNKKSSARTETPNLPPTEEDSAVDESGSEPSTREAQSAGPALETHDVTEADEALDSASPRADETPDDSRENSPENRSQAALEAPAPAPVAAPIEEVEVVDDEVSFGKWLRAQRELREIDLRDIADASKISLRYLEALEGGRFEVLPAAIFTKGFLRQYALYVGLDPEEVVNYYLVARPDPGEAVADSSARRARQRRRSASNARYIALILVLAALLLGVVWFLYQLRDGGFGTGDSGSAATPTTSSTTASSRASGSDAVAAGAESSTRPLQAPAAAGSEPDGRALSDGERLAGEPADRATSDPVPVDPSGAPLVVVLDFSGACWIEARIDGTRRLAELHQQGESLRIEAQEWIELKVGDIGKVALQRDGRSVDLAALPGTGSVRTTRFEVAPEVDEG